MLACSPGHTCRPSRLLPPRQKPGVVKVLVGLHLMATTASTLVRMAVRSEADTGFVWCREVVVRI